MDYIRGIRETKAKIHIGLTEDIVIEGYASSGPGGLTVRGSKGIVKSSTTVPTDVKLSTPHRTLYFSHQVIEDSYLLASVHEFGSGDAY